MNRLTLTVLLSFLSASSFSQQGMYGFNFGLGYTTSYHAHITPAFEGYHLWCITPHIYVGGSLFLQRYSFLYDAQSDPAAISYGDIVSIRQKTSYLFFSPKIDFGIGYRKYVHISLCGGAGVIMAGKQLTNEYSPLLNTSSGGIGADTGAVNTSYNIPKVIYRAAMGISERIPTRRYFNVILSQEFSYLPDKLNHRTPDMRTNYFSFTVGIMHKYPQISVEVD